MNQIATMRVPVVSPINAGTSIPDHFEDWRIIGFRDVRLIETADKLVRFFAVPVDGDSLKDHGIFDGDLLICRVTSIYEPDAIGLWQTPSGRTAKLASIDPDNFVTLHNGNGWAESWHHSEIRLLGIAVRVERDL